RGTIPTDPEDLRVNPDQYPVFRLSKPFSPPQPYPSPMLEILPSDEWRVTHTWADLFLITSASYEQRRCAWLEDRPDRCAKAFLGKRHIPQYFHAIFVDRDGRVAGGWQLLANPERIVLASERRRY